MKGLRVLLTNGWLGDRRGGTELYVFEVARTLRQRGHAPVVYSPILGSVAEEIRAAGVPVTDDPTTIVEVPDVIHGQHHPETMVALLNFPCVPAVFFSHGARSWQDRPPKSPRILRYVAVDQPNADRLLESGIPEQRIEVVLNFVDLECFRPRRPLPSRPRRALIFSNYAREDTYVPAVREACALAGISLDVIGYSAGAQVDRPQDVLPRYDLVFAKARAALEAMAVGAAVVLCDFDGLGPMVTSAEFDGLRPMNFGFRTLTGRLVPEAILEQIQRYDPADAQAVALRVRASAGLQQAVDRIEAIYQGAVAEYRALAPSLTITDETRAAAAYLASLISPLKEREQVIAWCERLLDETERRGAVIDELQHALTRAREAVGERTVWAERLLTEAEQRGAAIDELQEALTSARELVDERTVWAERLLNEAEARGTVIEELKTALDATQAAQEGAQAGLNASRAELGVARAQLDAVRAELAAAQAELHSMRTARRAYRLLRRLRRMLGLFRP